jgi:hypothetical protein
VALANKFCKFVIEEDTQKMDHVAVGSSFRLSDDVELIREL